MSGRDATARAIPSPSMGALHNYRHSRVGGNPEGGANGDAWSIWSCDSTDIELCKGPSMGEG